MFARRLRAVDPRIETFHLPSTRFGSSKKIQLSSRPLTASHFSDSACNFKQGQRAEKIQLGRVAASVETLKTGQAKRFHSNRGQHSVQSLYTIIAACGGAILLTFAYNRAFSHYTPSTTTDPSPESLAAPDSLANTPLYSEMPTPTGHLGNLTADQEVKLRELWAATLKTFGVEDSSTDGEAPDNSVAKAKTESTLSVPVDKEKKKRRSLFGRKHDKDKDGDGMNSGASTPSLSPADDDKYGQVKEFHEILNRHSEEDLRRTFWTMVKADHPDALLLRFLRARKWDVEKALVMLVSTMNWRFVEMHVDDDIMMQGEGGAAEEAQSSDKAIKKEGDDFLAQLRLGKSFLHGTDKEGRPLCVVRVRLHKPGEQSEKSMERFTVYVIETARLVLRPPVETACIIFDMSHFGLSNMDYTPVKFMIKCFEANYPESLGAVLVHNAPFVFSAIWNIIKGWLDPVVASKIHFTKNVKELEHYIPRSQIIKELGGDENWEYKYVEPIPGENNQMKDEAPKIKLQEERTNDVLQYQKKTFEWIASGAESGSIKKERDVLAQKLHDNYWQLDPYIRARTLYDRAGMILPGGKINFYPGKQAVNGSSPLPERAAAADDVD